MEAIQLSVVDYVHNSRIENWVELCMCECAHMSMCVGADGSIIIKN